VVMGGENRGKRACWKACWHGMAWQCLRIEKRTHNRRKSADKQIKAADARRPAKGDRRQKKTGYDGTPQNGRRNTRTKWAIAQQRASTPDCWLSVAGLLPALANEKDGARGMGFRSFFTLFFHCFPFISFISLSGDFGISTVLDDFESLRAGFLFLLSELVSELVLVLGFGIDVYIECK